MHAILLLVLVSLASCHGLRSPPPWDCTDKAVLNISADGYHWKPSDNPLKSQYVEWWFFTVLDESNDLGLVFGYGLSDPGNFFGQRGAVVSSMVYPQFNVAPMKNISTLNTNTLIPFEQFVAHSQNATVTMGPENSITVIDEYTYHLVGRSADGLTWWNLTYVQLADGMNENVEVPELMQLDWVSYMPAARVSGVMHYQGQTIQINNALGYHDHNYGYWPEAIFNWLWAQFSGVSATTGKRFTSVTGAYKIPVVTNDTYIGYVIIRYGDQHIKLGTLCGDKFELIPMAFEPWPGHPGKKVSVHNVASAESDQYRVVFDWKTKVWALNPGGLPMHLLVAEQISTYNVQLYQKTNGQWSLLDSFVGDGFNEWCDMEI